MHDFTNILFPPRNLKETENEKNFLRQSQIIKKFENNRIMTRMLPLILAAAAVLSVAPAATSAAAASGEVSLRQGRLRGTTFRSRPGGLPIHAFLGVPYARPPVGARRFSRPQEADPWPEEEVFDATRWVMCPQNDIPVVSKKPKGQEDCLVLNVYATELPDKQVESVRSRDPIAIRLKRPIYDERGGTDLYIR